MEPSLQYKHPGPSSSKSKDVTILVTGFCPFQEKFPVNPSFEITRSLPQVLPSTSQHKAVVHIISYGTPIRVAYDDVRQLIPTIHEAYEGTVDLVLHIGMASGRKHYTLERLAHRDGYQKNKDLDGKMPPAGEGQQLFGDCPEILTPSLDYAEVLRMWQSDVTQDSAGTNPDCRPSDDAGRYLCEYIYFNSLAYFGRKSGHLEGGLNISRPVLFLHVPAESDEIMLERGKRVAIAAIRAMADSLTNKRENGSD